MCLGGGTGRLIVPGGASLKRDESSEPVEAKMCPGCTFSYRQVREENAYRHCSHLLVHSSSQICQMRRSSQSPRANYFRRGTPK